MSNVQGNNESLNGRAGSEDHSLRHRVGQARDMVENVRDKAEVAFRDRPYMLPVAAGAVGLGLGMLLGSKILRFVLFTAVGTVLSDMVGGEIKKMSKDFIEDLQDRIGGDAEEA
jgi:hypothetical protein